MRVLPSFKDVSSIVIPPQQPVLRMKFNIMDRSDLQQPAGFGVSYNTISVDISEYLKELFLKFQAKGGRFFRANIRHIHEIFESGISSFSPDRTSIREFGPPAAIILCDGIAARFLGGIADALVVPVRRVSIRAKIPWVTTGKMFVNQPGPCLSVTPVKNGDVGIHFSTAVFWGTHLSVRL